MSLAAFRHILACDAIVEYGDAPSDLGLLMVNYRGKYLRLDPTSGGALDIEDLKTAIPVGARWAFVSFGQFDTAPKWVRETMVAAASGASVYVLVVKDTDGAEDLAAYFERWCAKIPGEVEWTTLAVQDKPGHRMILGVRK